MKRLVCLVLVLVMTLSLCACGGNRAEVADTPTWQEQYDLGVRYLSEGNYEEAIIAFMAAIEIDPKQPNAYLKAAEAYEAMGDMEQAIAILNGGAEATGDADLTEYLARLSMSAEQEELLSQNGVLTVLVEQTVINNEDKETWRYTYDEQGYLSLTECVDVRSGDQKCTISYVYDETAESWTATWVYSQEGVEPDVYETWLEPGTYKEFLSGTPGGDDAWIITDPFPGEDCPEVIYGTDYEGRNAHRVYANCSYDANGNVVQMDSYTLEGVFVGTCLFTWAEIEIQP